MADYERILIIKPSSLGDIVHALPTLAAIRARYPRASITWLVKRQWAAILERVDALDRVWRVPSASTGWFSHVPGLRAERFQVVVDLQGLLRSGLMSWLTGCKRRVGFATAREGSAWFYTDRVPVPALNMHAVDRYLLAAASLDVPVPAELDYGIRPFVDDRARVADLLARHGLASDRTWIAMAVAARWTTKRWPPQSFAETADRVQYEGLGRVVLIGAPEDRPTARLVARRMKTKPVDLVGAVEVGLLPALLEHASVMVTNDSGPMHIAAAMGTPVVALFGPTSPSRTGPYGAGHLVMTGRVPCSPCFSRVCRNTVRLECLSTVTPEQVLGAVRQQSARRRQGAEAMLSPCSN